MVPTAAELVKEAVRNLHRYKCLPSLSVNLCLWLLHSLSLTD